MLQKWIFEHRQLVGASAPQSHGKSIIYEVFGSLQLTKRRKNTWAEGSCFSVTVHPTLQKKKANVWSALAGAFHSLASYLTSASARPWLSSASYIFDLCTDQSFANEQNKSDQLWITVDRLWLNHLFLLFQLAMCMPLTLL